MLANGDWTAPELSSLPHSWCTKSVVGGAYCCSEAGNAVEPATGPVAG